MTDMTATPPPERRAATGTTAASGRRDEEIREALEQEQDQAARAIDSERRDARHAQDRTVTQRRDARTAQDQINVQADTQRRDARDAQDQIDILAHTQRRGARDTQDQIDVQADAQRRCARRAQDQAETTQDSERQDAQNLFDARRDSERNDAFEQNVTIHQQASALEQANQNLEAFAYTISHDLRAPLRAMYGFSAVLLDECGTGLGEEGRGYVEQIQAASEHMSQLIDALLHLARIARAEMRPRPVDLGAEAAR